MRNRIPKTRAQTIVTIYGDYTVAIVGDMNSHEIYMQPTDTQSSIWNDIENDWAGYALKTHLGQTNHSDVFEDVRLYETEHVLNNPDSGYIGMEIGDMVNIALEEFKILTECDSVEHAIHREAIKTRDEVIRLSKFDKSNEWEPPINSGAIFNLIHGIYQHDVGELSQHIANMISYGHMDELIKDIIADECYFIQ